jgi:hypothetical protein
MSAEFESSAPAGVGSCAFRRSAGMYSVWLALDPTS